MVVVSGPKVRWAKELLAVFDFDGAHNASASWKTASTRKSRLESFLAGNKLPNNHIVPWLLGIGRIDGTSIEELRLEQVGFKVEDVDALLRDLAQLGVSRRTLFPDLAGLPDFVRWKHFHKVGGYRVQG
jgi:hypothetical protein